MPRLVEQKVSIGQDVYGRTIEATRQSDSGTVYWTIVIHAYDQRDDTQYLRGLTDQNLRDLIQALNCVKT
jgi:hypothetical protein